MIVTNKEKKDKLKHDIEIIKEKVLSNYSKSIISIILYGSYGREEGAFYKYNNKICVYNDYDFILVVKNKIQTSNLNKIKKDILKSIDIKWIDISQKNINELRKVKPSIFNYDLKYGSKVIYGEKKILDKIPKIEPCEITLVDAEILFFTRLYTFLGSLSVNSFLYGIDGEESRFFRNQMAKAILAIVDVVLLQNKVYDSSYVKRNNLAKKIIKNDNDLLNLFDWALNEKMYPKSSKFTKSQLKSFYKKIATLYFNEMMKALSKLYDSNIRNTDDLILAKKYSARIWILKLKDLIIYKSLKQYNKQFILNILQSYIFEYYLLDKKHRKILFNKIEILIQKLNFKTNSSFNSWDDMRLFISKIRTY